MTDNEFSQLNLRDPVVQEFANFIRAQRGRLSLNWGATVAMHLVDDLRIAAPNKGWGTIVKEAYADLGKSSLSAASVTAIRAWLRRFRDYLNVSGYCVKLGA